jgi:hypothetical protein
MSRAATLGGGGVRVDRRRPLGRGELRRPRRFGGHVIIIAIIVIIVIIPSSSRHHLVIT